MYLFIEQLILDRMFENNYSFLRYSEPKGVKYNTIDYFMDFAF